MKHFYINKEKLKDLELLTQMIKQFIYHERISMPISVQISDEHLDCFVRHEVIVIVSSMALIKL